MQKPIWCPSELRQEESHLLWLCGVHESELSPLLAPGLQIKDETPQMNRLKPFPQQG